MRENLLSARISWWWIGIGNNWWLWIFLLCNCNYIAVTHVDDEIPSSSLKKYRWASYLKKRYFIFKVLCIWKTHLRTWSSIDRGLLRVHQDLAMVLSFADFDTHTNDCANKGQSNNTPNHSASYCSRRGRTVNKHMFLLLNR